MATILQLEDKLLVWKGCSVVDTSTVDAASKRARDIAATAGHVLGKERRRVL